MKRFVRAQGTSSKGDDNPTTFQLWNGKSFRFAAKSHYPQRILSMDSTSQQRKTIEPDQRPSRF